MKKLILFTGYKGSGKTTLAKSLKNVKVISLADTLKNMLCVMFQITKEELEKAKNDTIKIKYGSDEINIDIRNAMKTLGTEWGRTIDKNIWIAMTINKINQTKEDVVAIDDLRFLNEEKKLKEAFDDVKIIRIKRCTDNDKDKHQSETEIESIKEDYTIINNSTVKDAVEKINKIL